MVSVKKKKKLKRSVIVFMLAFIAVTIMTIGFALFDALLQINASAVVLPDGGIYISNISIVENSLVNASANPEITNDGESVDFNLSFTTINDSTATYSAQFDITITNDSYNDYVYTSFDYPLTINRSSNGDEIESTYIQYSISGISPGDFIYSKQSLTFRATFTFTNPFADSTTDTFVINGEFAPTVHEETVAHILATLNEPTTVDLTGNNMDARISVHVINTYSYDKYFDITFDKGYYFVTDLRGNDLTTQMIGANSEADFSFKIDRGVGYQFPFSVDRITVYVTPLGDSSINAGRLTVYVDKTVELHDETPPTISNVQAVIQDTNGSVKVTWHGEDVSNVSNYIIKAMDSSDNVVKSVETGNDDEEIIITGLNKSGNAALQDIEYYFVVAGVDDSTRHNSGESYMTGAQTTSGYASRSTKASYRWLFSVTYKGANSITKPSNTTVLRNQSFTSGTFSVSGNYTLDSTVGVKMGGNTITSGYTWNRTNSNQRATISFNAGVITGDIEVTPTATDNSCLAEGTKILLANGKHKKIEDIEYTDLLMVYDHINGGITYVYPAWIEEKGTSPHYEKITFSDGSLLKVINKHDLFDVDKKRYVDVSNQNEFNIGSRVYKVENNELKIVTVKSIEYLKENINYYGVVSTKYYNIIANGFITNDPTTSICNLYGFNDNAIYSDNYKKISNSNNLTYEQVNFIPYYLYTSLDIRNAIGTIGESLDMNFLGQYIFKTTKPIIRDSNKNYFAVSTSNKKMYKLYAEGSIYTLPINNNVNCYYNTSDNKCYKPGERIVVNHSMHFIAKQ